MGDGIGLAEALLGLDGFRVLEVDRGRRGAGDHDRDDGRRSRAVGGAGPGPSRRVEPGSRSGIWPASGARPGWCGSSAGGAAGRPRCEARTWTETLPACSMRRWC